MGVEGIEPPAYSTSKSRSTTELNARMIYKQNSKNEQENQLTIPEKFVIMQVFFENLSHRAEKNGNDLYHHNSLHAPRQICA